ncbi:DUF6624 domain-containing protein [Kribbella sp. NPDC059898]|uniref:DUF6624 domain-containing protein n=1 Tax=Kribbella sp. NPDC059898 TaxID=3346995 RepID=UPI00364F2EE2
MAARDLKEELLRRMDLDQSARAEVQDLPDEARLDRWPSVARIDHDNTAWLATIIASGGWPRISDVGEQGATAAWILAQHSDDAPAVQREFHQHMAAAAACGEAEPRLLAYLEDRIRVNAGRPQLYGTQFITVGNGEPQPRPIHDRESLDQRRASVGLEPFADYAATMRSDWTRRQTADTTRPHDQPGG